MTAAVCERIEETHESFYDLYVQEVERYFQGHSPVKSVSRDD